MFRIVPFLAVLFSCGHNSNKSSDTQVEKIQAIADSLTPKVTSNYYFPVKPHRSRVDSSFRVVALDSFLNDWFSSQLFALNEPVLKGYPSDFEVYRFTWLRTFHRPISIRMDKLGEVVSLTVKMSDGAGGYEPGKLILNKTLLLSTSELRTFTLKLNEIRFWNLPTDADNQHGTDGSEWILEAKQSKKYHFVHFWSPDFTEQERKFKACCEYLVSLAKFTKGELPDDDVY
jgi:hypothetical protein